MTSTDVSKNKFNTLLTYEVLQKVPGIGKKINAGLTYSILAVISFKIFSLGIYIAIP
jgi:hypothetical protein